MATNNEKKPFSIPLQFGDRIKFFANGRYIYGKYIGDESKEIGVVNALDRTIKIPKDQIEFVFDDEE